MREELFKTFATANAKTWESRLSAAGVPAGAVLTIPQMTEEPQIAERALLKSGSAPTGVDGSFRTVGAPFRLNGDRSNTLQSTPNLGEHTDIVLKELGFSGEEAAAFRESGAVA